MIGKTNASGGGKLAIGDITQDTKYATDPNFVKCQGQTYTSGAVYDGLKDKMPTFPNGMNWIPRLTQQSMKGTVYANGLYFCGGSNSLFSSPDSVNWTDLKQTPNSDFSGVAYGNGIYVIALYNGRLRTSTDGITWTGGTTPFYSESRAIYGIIFANGIFVAYGQENYGIATSIDGITWTQRYPYGLSTIGVMGVAYGNGIFVAIGGTKISTSNDGANWTERTSSFATGGEQYISFGNGKFVMIGNSNQIATSINGITWTNVQHSLTANYFNGLAFGDDLFLLLYYNTLAISYDGETWQQFAQNYNGLTLSYGNGKFLVTISPTKLFSTGTGYVADLSHLIQIPSYSVPTYIKFA